MANSESTPLVHLPNNNTADSDLVNKILNQLDNADKNEQVSDDVDVIYNNVVSDTKMEQCNNMPPSGSHATAASSYTVGTKNTRDDMPSPQGIQKMLSLLDTPQFYHKIKISVMIAFMYFLFMYFSDKFKNLVSQLPLSTIAPTGELTGMGEVLKAISFGIAHLCISIFFEKT